MSECKINAPDSAAAWDPCDRCGLGPCHVWREDFPPISEPKSDAEPPKPQSAGPTEPRPDPAYAAALSETSILVDARARAFDLAMRLAAQSEKADEIDFPRLLNVSNRVLKYILEGK